ncbi:NmrA family transcriptional regulator [Aspergillus steynii IBT 23096]|uniref:NmrA family transcriptional regulator n=1 Tax=Aspergillus steynii IBT 23096 TaxID=1392250 RepID=A0A2I2G3Y3_9EURO|nr:NmrA family transcriptional regulator [Aspergillus steynii IBT 23096]PLB47581.1 NmrA family transcriptional regulator [Aspergillus steynii IBT 23096]
MKKTIVVFGATGNQGGSVIDHILSDIDLSSRYRVRAVTRNPDSQAAMNLKNRSVEIAMGDMDRPDTVERVLVDASIVFILTTFQTTKAHEIAQGKSVADAAVANNLEYIIYSTLPSVTDISGGKYLAVEYYDSKAETEKYIRTLPVKAAFFAPGCYMQNFQNEMKPQALGDGTYGLVYPVSPQTQLPLIDIAESGKFVGAILADPDRFRGQVLSASTEVVSFEEVAQILSKSSGKTIRFEQTTEKSFRDSLPADLADTLLETMKYFEDYGYYGPNTEGKVKETAQIAQGELTTLQRYLEREPLELKLCYLCHYTYLFFYIILTAYKQQAHQNKDSIIRNL